METSPDASFLYAAIEDLQGTVRALDIKAEVLLVAMTVPLYDASGIAATLSKLLREGLVGFRILTAIIVLWIALAWIAAFIATFRVLVASHNPSDAIPDHAPAKGSFFAGHLFKFTRKDLIRDRLVTCSHTLRQHLDELPTGDEQVKAELAFEHLKLAFICSRKIAMFNFAVRLMTAGVYASVLLLILHIVS